MLIVRRVLLSALLLSTVSCRSTRSRTSCDNDSLTSYPALLVLAPHPDDETLGFAGLIDAYVHAGKPVTVVVMTDGDAYCEACKFWKNSSVAGAMCNASELSEFGEVRRNESAAAANIIGGPAPRFLRYPDTGLAAAWRHFNANEHDAPLHRSDFSNCTSCAACGYGDGPQTTLTARTLTTSLREIIAAAPKGALIATTHWLDGHPDHAALGNFVRTLNTDHAIAFAVIHARTKNTANSDCWYPGPAAPDCPCMDDEQKALADPNWIARNASQRLQPSNAIVLPTDAEYGEAKNFCLSERAEEMKGRAIRAYPSQLGHLARGGEMPAALDGIIDCSGYLTSFVRRNETFVVIQPSH